MKTRFFAALGTLLLMAGSAQASLELVEYLELSSVIGNPTEEATWIENYLSVGPLTYLQKWDVDKQQWDVVKDGDQDPTFGDYTISGTGKKVLGVEWDLTSTAYDLTYVLVKDGATNPPGDDPKFFLYSLYKVTPDQFKDSLGVQYVQVNELASKDISHISFFGVESVIPEPTMLLVWSGLAGLALQVRRRRV